MAESHQHIERDRSRDRERIVKLEALYEQLAKSVAEIRDSTRSIDESIREMVLTRREVETAVAQVRAMETSLDVTMQTIRREATDRERESRQAREDLWKKVHEINREKDAEHRIIDSRIASIDGQIATGKWAAVAIIAAITFAANLLANLIF